MLLPIGEYLPDQPAPGPGSGLVANVVPRTAQSYAPMPSLAAYSGNALAARAQGAAATLDSAGNVALFAGDAHDLYRLAPGTTSFAPVSKAPGAYGVAADGRWSFAQFGQRLIASSFADPMQVFDLLTPTGFGDLAAAAPRARHLAVLRNFLLAGFTSDPVGGVQPQRVWWSALNDPTGWPTPGTFAAQAAQSDFQDLPGEHGWLQAIVADPGFADAALFFERAVFRMQYTGAPYVFSFAPAEKARGTPAPGSVVQLGNAVYYLGEDGFYAFDGTASRPIGALKVDKSFFADLDQTWLDRVTAAADPINKLIFWAYPGPGNAGGTPNRMLAYHTVLDRWSLIVDQPVELLFRALSVGWSLDALATIHPSLDALPFSLDSRIWTAGRVLLAGFDAGHRLGYFSGPALAPTLETPEVQLAAGRRALVGGARPVVDGGAPTVAIGARDRPGDAVRWGPAVAMNAAGDCPQRAAGRYHRARLTLPAASTVTHIQGVELTARPEGLR